MRWIVAGLLVLAALGCAGSDDAQPQAEVESTTPTSSAPEKTATEAKKTERLPTSVEEILARLPPFDVPVSPEVDKYRRASISAFIDYCVHGKGGADKAAYVAENARLLDGLPIYPGATFDGEFSRGEPQPGYCLEGLGPVLSYETYRRYRLPSSAQDSAVTAFYERSLSDWMRENHETRPCDREFRRGDASLTMSSCGGALLLTADHAAYGEKRLPSLPKLPPRPTGKQYPWTTYDPADPRQPEPTGYSVQPGKTCERSIASGREGPVTLINPPHPGIRATLVREPFETSGRAYDQFARVQWRFAKILGDCPPVKLRLTIVKPQPNRLVYSLPFDIRARSGTLRLPVLDIFRGVRVLGASAESVDGHMSRPVNVLIRR